MIANDDDGVGFTNGKTNQTAIAPNIRMTPPSFDGIDRKIA